MSEIGSDISGIGAAIAAHFEDTILVDVIGFLISAVLEASIAAIIVALAASAWIRIYQAVRFRAHRASLMYVTAEVYLRSLNALTAITKRVDKHRVFIQDPQWAFDGALVQIENFKSEIIISTPYIPDDIREKLALEIKYLTEASGLVTFAASRWHHIEDEVPAIESIEPNRIDDHLIGENIISDEGLPIIRGREDFIMISSNIWRAISIISDRFAELKADKKFKKILTHADAYRKQSKINFGGNQTFEERSAKILAEIEVLKADLERGNLMMAQISWYSHFWRKAE